MEVRAIQERVTAALVQAGDPSFVYAVQDGEHDPSLQFHRGLRISGHYASCYFLTNAESMRCSLCKPAVLLYSGGLQSARELLPLLERIVKAKKPLLVLAFECGDEVLSTLVVNKLRSVLSVCACTISARDPYRRIILEDIAFFAGAQIFGKDDGCNPNLDAALWELGTIGWVEVSDTTIDFIGVDVSDRDIDRRAQKIRSALGRETGDAARFLEHRLENMDSKFVVIPKECETELRSRRVQERETALDLTRLDPEEAKRVARDLSALLNRVSNKEIPREVYETQKRMILRTVVETHDTTLGKRHNPEGKLDFEAIVQKAIESSGDSNLIKISAGNRVRTTMQAHPGLHMRSFLADARLRISPDAGSSLWSYTTILIYDGVLDDPQKILPIFQKVLPLGWALMILAKGFSQEVIDTLVLNREKGTLRVCAGGPAGNSDEQSILLHDAATVLKVALFGEGVGLGSIQEATLSQLGLFHVLEATEEWINIVHGGPEDYKLQGQINQATEKLLPGDSAERALLLRRIQQGCSRFSLIATGGFTEDEILRATTEIGALVKGSQDRAGAGG